MRVYSRGPLRVFCPKCSAFRPSASLRMSSRLSSRQLTFDDAADISWYRRTRRCTSCGQEFKTAESSESLLDELHELRCKVAGYRSKAVARAVLAIRERRKWMSEGASDVPKEVARELIRASAWWLRHPSGAVRAPAHAYNIEKLWCGWSLKLGANGFAAALAADRARRIALDAFDAMSSGRPVHETRLRQRLRDAICGCVLNFEDELYSPYAYPMEGNDLVFGVHSIDVKDCVDFLYEHTGLAEAMAVE